MLGLSSVKIWNLILSIYLSIHIVIQNMEFIFIDTHLPVDPDSHTTKDLAPLPHGRFVAAKWLLAQVLQFSAALPTRPLLCEVM